MYIGLIVLLLAAGQAHSTGTQFEVKIDAKDGSVGFGVYQSCGTYDEDTIVWSMIAGYGYVLKTPYRKVVKCSKPTDKVCFCDAEKCFVFEVTSDSSSKFFSQQIHTGFSRNTAHGR